MSPRQVERTWAVLENYWNGSILDELETALKFAQNMTWKGKGSPNNKMPSRRFRLKGESA